MILLLSYRCNQLRLQAHSSHQWILKRNSLNLHHLDSTTSPHPSPFLLLQAFLISCSQHLVLLRISAQIHFQVLLIVKITLVLLLECQGPRVEVSISFRCQTTHSQVATSLTLEEECRSSSSRLNKASICLARTTKALILCLEEVVVDRLRTLNFLICCLDL